MSSPAPDLSRWLTKEQAASQMGISLRSLERKMTDGLVPSIKERPGGRSLISPETVAQFGRATIAVPVSRPPDPPQMAEVAKVQPDQPVTRAEMMAFMQRVQIADSNPRRWMKLTSAADICGLSVNFLKKQIKAGQLEFVDDKYIKVRRDTLDELAGQVAKKRGKR